MVCLARFLQIKYITILDCVPSFRFYGSYMGEKVTLLILLVFLVLFVIFVLGFLTLYNQKP